jgi:uncharacterized protein YndB with AHSA1/START domain
VQSSFAYVTYILGTPAVLWEALTTPESTKSFWFGHHIASSWSRGSPWGLVKPDGQTSVVGTILEIEDGRHIVLSWRDEQRPELHAEGFSQCSIDLEAIGGATKVTLAHSIDVRDSKLIALVSNSWPQVFANLKSFLETGDIVLQQSLRPQR